MILRSTLGAAIPRSHLRAIATQAFAGIDHRDVVIEFGRPQGRHGGGGRMSATPLPARIAARHPAARYFVRVTVRPDWDAEYAAYPSRLPGVAFSGRDEFLLVTTAHEARHVAQHRSDPAHWSDPAAREADAEAHAAAILHTARG